MGPKVQRDAEDPGRLLFKCPGCGCLHLIMVGEGPGPRWFWNLDADRPTFSPSILITAPRVGADGSATRDAMDRCHSFVTAGRIEFLADCSHTLAGQTVDLPPLAS